MLNTKIKSHIDKIWDSLWSGGIANPLTCMEQISYFIFMRRISEQDEQARQKAEFSGKDHQSVFEGDVPALVDALGRVQQRSSGEQKVVGGCGGHLRPSRSS